jgi:diacylglycerol O-acyltransferase / wax synthase
MEPVALQFEDRQILAAEGPTIAGHTCKVVIVDDDALDVDALRARMAARLHGAPRLACRLGGSARAPAWVADPDFDITAQVGPAATGGGDLPAIVAGLFAQHLPRDRPLWRLDVVSPVEGGSALVWRIHHALADGTAAMRLARVLLWDEDDDAAAPQARRSAAAAHADDDARRRAHLAGFLAREVARSPGRSPFDGTVGTQRRVAFASVPLAPLHDAARAACDAPLNDAVLSLVSGALRRWLIAHHGPLGEMRARVPVSLHHEGDDAANRDAFFSVALPLDEPDPLVRLRAVHAATTLRKENRDAETMDQLLRDLARVSPALQRLAVRVEGSPRRFAVNVSNVPGPRGPVSVLGAPVRDLHCIAEIGRRHALRVAVVSFADRLTFGLCADPLIVDDLEAMAAGVVAEADLLTA